MDVEPSRLGVLPAELLYNERQVRKDKYIHEGVLKDVDEKTNR